MPIRKTAMLDNNDIIAEKNYKLSTKQLKKKKPSKKKVIKKSKLIMHKSKVGNLSEGWPEGSLFNSYYTKV